MTPQLSFLFEDHREIQTKLWEHRRPIWTAKTAISQRASRLIDMYKIDKQALAIKAINAICKLDPKVCQPFVDSEDDWSIRFIDVCLWD